MAAHRFNPELFMKTLSFDPYRIDRKLYREIDSFHDSFSITESIVSDLMYGSIDKNMTPYISVIIPTFNRDTIFCETLKSVLHQQSVDFIWELLVIDNTPLDERGTTPALRIIQKIEDSHIQYYHNRENIGSGYNWNRGVQLARGKWVCFLHDDDVLCSDALFHIGKIIRRHANLRKPLGYIHARRRDFTGNFDENEAKRHDKPYELELTRAGALIHGHTRTGSPSCGTTILKEAYLRTGGINYGYGGTADAVLGYQIMRDYTVLESGKVLGGYRWQDNDTLRKETLQNLVEADLLFARYRYGQTLASRIFGLLSERVQHNLNIEGKLALARKAQQPMDLHDFDQILPYKKTNMFTSFLYKMTRQVYHQIEKDNKHYNRE